MRQVFQSLCIGVNDLKESWKGREFWALLAYREVRAQYRRTIIGPLWISVAMAIYVFALDIVYGRIFGLSSEEFMPWVIIGLVAWYFINSAISESLNVFITYRGYILQHKKPMFTYSMIPLTRAFLLCAHHMIVVVAVIVLLQVPFLNYYWMIIPGFLLFVFAVSWIGMLLSVISLRYRDVPQIITNIMQLAFLVTPVMYKPDHPEVANSLIVRLNPFAHILAVVRDPLLGKMPPVHSLEIAAGLGVVGWVITLYVFGRFRNRIAYWL